MYYYVLLNTEKKTISKNVYSGYYVRQVKILCFVQNATPDFFTIQNIFYVKIPMTKRQPLKVKICPLF